MVRKQVPSLYQRTLSIVYEQILEFVYQHWDSNCVLCTVHRRFEQCPEMNIVKEYLTLPLNVTQDVFNFVPASQYSHISTTKKRHLFYFLLHHSGFEIGTFTFRQKEDALFLMKYGETIKELGFSYCLIDESGFRKTLKTLWQPVLSSVRNIKVLDLGYTLALSKDDFQIIGSECTLLETLKGFDADSSITEKSFDSLCFTTHHGKRIRHNCCSSLRNIEFMYFDDNLRRLNGIICYLLQNIPNLRSFVHPFDADRYLESTGFDIILNTTLEEICVSRLTNDLVLSLKLFCPNMKQFQFGSLVQGTLTLLNMSFPNLERLELENCDTSEDSYIMSDVMTPVWLNVKYLELCIRHGPILNLSLLAKHLPVLEELSICHCVKLKWNGITRFKSLISADLQFIEPTNLLAVTSFAQTIKSLTLVSYGAVFDQAILSVFVEVPFPALNILDISKWVCDVGDIINIVKHCSLLENFALFDEYEDVDPISKRKIREITEILSNYNLQCNLFKS